MHSHPHKIFPFILADVIPAKQLRLDHTTGFDINKCPVSKIS